MDKIFFIACLLQFTKSVYSNPCGGRHLISDELIIANRCPYTVWPGIVSYSGSEELENGGFELKSWDTQVFHVSPKWSGKIWGRTGCQYSQDGCLFICETGDCGKGLCCRNNTGIGPISIAEIAFGASPECLDRYSVSLAEGYNLQIQVRPVEGGHTKITNKRFDCNLAGCFKDVNSVCPEELVSRNRRKGIKIGCQNPCAKFVENSDKKNSIDYEVCVRNKSSTNFFSIVNEACPDVLVYEKHVCEGVVYTCRKNNDGFSAYEVIFCP